MSGGQWKLSATQSEARARLRDEADAAAHRASWRETLGMPCERHGAGPTEGCWTFDTDYGPKRAACSSRIRAWHFEYAKERVLV